APVRTGRSGRCRGNATNARRSSAISCAATNRNTTCSIRSRGRRMRRATTAGRAGCAPTESVRRAFRGGSAHRRLSLDAALERLEIAISVALVGLEVGALGPFVPCVHEDRLLGLGARSGDLDQLPEPVLE